MSVRVNLLPGEVRERGRESRSRVLAGVLVLFLILGLAAITFLQRGSISDAQAELAAVQEQNAALRADIAALQPFADLEARADDSVDVVGAALGSEMSLATILQDLSAVLPPDAQFDTVAINFLDAPGEPSAGGTRLIVGDLLATGRVLTGLAPGVERLAIDVSRVAAFENAFVTTTTVDEDGVSSFALEVELGPEVLTNRYALVDEESDS